MLMPTKSEEHRPENAWGPINVRTQVSIWWRLHSGALCLVGQTIRQRRLATLVKRNITIEWERVYSIKNPHNMEKAKP